MYLKIGVARNKRPISSGADGILSWSSAVAASEAVYVMDQGEGATATSLCQSAHHGNKTGLVCDLP